MTTDPLTRIRALLDEIIETIDKVVDPPNPPAPVKPNNRPKLTKRDVLLIRQMKRNGETQAAIAETFDVNAGTISRIVRGQYWR